MKPRNGFTIQGNARKLKADRVRKNRADMYPASDSGWPVNTSAAMDQNVVL